jgi:hypothetical protein
MEWAMPCQSAAERPSAISALQFYGGITIVNRSNPCFNPLKKPAWCGLFYFECLNPWSRGGDDAKDAE